MPFQHKRDNILNEDERTKSARKCISLLDNPEVTLGMTFKDHSFFSRQQLESQRANYAPSEPQLQWLRDLVSRYVTN